jgi:hypothetical protein
MRDLSKQEDERQGERGSIAAMTRSPKVPEAAAKARASKRGWSTDPSLILRIAGGSGSMEIAALAAVTVRTEPSFGVEARVALPITGFVITGRQRNWDITLNGKEFIGVFEAAQSSGPGLQIQVVLNWFEELKQRMAAK